MAVHSFRVEIEWGPAPEPSGDKRIVFEPIPAGSAETALPPSSGRGAVPVSGFGSAQTLAELGGAGMARLRLTQASVAGDAVEAPSFGDGFGHLGLAAAYSYGPAATAPAVGAGSIPLVGLALAATDVGLGRLILRGFGESVAEGSADPPPAWHDTVAYVGELVDLGTNVLHDALHLGAVRDEVAAASWRVAHNFRGETAGRATISLGGEISAVYRILIEEGVRLDAGVVADHTAVSRAVDRLLLTGLAGSYLDAAQQVVVGLVFAELVDLLAAEKVADAAVLGAVAAELYTAVERAIENALLDITAAPSHTGVIVLAERLLASSVAAGSAELRDLLLESIGFSARLSLDSGEYVAWVLNTESAGLSSYTNYPFNSFAKVAGRYYGLTGAGLYRLDGGTDEGAAINSRIRAGMSDFGSRALKNIPDAYVAYTSDGTLLLRTITVNKRTGEKEAANYRLVPRGASALRENRFQMGRGVQSVDWDFELENIDGSDFSLESIEFRPVWLTRRTRG